MTSAASWQFARRVRRLTRAVGAAALLATTLAGSLASHHHSLFSASEDLSAHSEDQFLTRHNPLSRASHWHAVIAVVHEQDCVACHTQRLPGVLAQGHQLEPVLSAKATSVSLPARKLASSLPSSGSRGPPFLL